jgi:copper transport protein
MVRGAAGRPGPWARGGARGIVRRAGRGPRRGSCRGTLALVAVAVLVGAVAPPAAQAHAQLERTIPDRGATVAHQPQLVTFAFGEPVEGNFGAVRVYDARARRVDDGRVVHPGGDSHALGVGLKPGLPQGTYTATYRVISADGHPVSGGLVFSIGRPGAAPAQTVGDLIGKNRSGPATEVAFGLARGLGYAAIALGIGALAFLALVWGPAVASGGTGLPGFGRRVVRLLWLAVGLGLLTTLLGIVLQGATAGGISFWAAAKPALVREVLGTRFGSVWGVRALAWVAFGVVLAVAGRGGDRERGAQRALALVPAAGTEQLCRAGGPRVSGGAALAALAVPAAVLALTPALSGHASTQSPVALLLPLDVLHVVAMSTWLGGLALLLFAVPAATRALEPPERSRLLAAVLVRFSPLALGCVVALAVTGVVQAYVHVRAWDALLHTAFGRAVVIKLVLLLGLVALGAVNRQRVLPGLRRAAEGALAPGAAGLLLRRTLRAEVALIVVVLGVTSALVSYAPPVSLASGPFSATKRLGPLDLELTIDPARVGANELHLYLLNAGDGTPFTGTKQLMLRLSQPGKGIGPIEAQPRKAGPGHYIVDALQLVPGGDWRLEVADRVSEFDEYTTSLKMPVR